MLIFNCPRADYQADSFYSKMGKSGVLFNFVHSLQHSDNRELNLEVITTIIKSGVPAPFANEQLLIIY